MTNGAKEIFRGGKAYIVKVLHHDDHPIFTTWDDQNQAKSNPLKRVILRMIGVNSML